MSDELTDSIAGIPLLSSTACPCDGEVFRERLKEELRALIAVYFTCSHDV